jgi:hypothetical protein
LEVAGIGRYLDIGNPIYDLLVDRDDTFIEPSPTITIPPARAHRFEPVLRHAVHHLDQLAGACKSTFIPAHAYDKRVTPIAR